MNEASSDVLKIIIGVVLTILVALMAFGFYNKAQDMSKTADEQLAQMDDMLKNGNLDKYDGATVKGSEVISCIQSNKNAVLCVQIVNGGTTTEYGRIFLRKRTGNLPQPRTKRTLPRFTSTQPMTMKENLCIITTILPRPL